MSFTSSGFGTRCFCITAFPKWPLRVFSFRPECGGLSALYQDQLFKGHDVLSTNCLCAQVLSSFPNSLSSALTRRAEVLVRAFKEMIQRTDWQLPSIESNLFKITSLKAQITNYTLLVAWYEFSEEAAYVKLLFIPKPQHEALLQIQCYQIKCKPSQWLLKMWPFLKTGKPSYFSPSFPPGRGNISNS